MLLLIVFKRLWGREYTKAPQRLGGTCGCLSILTLQTLQPCSGLPGPGQKPQNHLTLQSHRAGRHSTGSLSLFLYHSYVWNLLLDNYYHFSFHGPFYFFTRWCFTWNGTTPAQRVVPPPQRLWVTRSCVTPCVSAQSVHPYSRSDLKNIIFGTTAILKLHISLIHY